MINPSLQCFPYPLTSPDGRLHTYAQLCRLCVAEESDSERHIELVFIRIPASTDKPGPPIIYLRGGPGFAASDVARTRLHEYLVYAETGDVILLDQRGVGLSLPTLHAFLPWQMQALECFDRNSLLDRAKQLAKQTADFWREQGVDLGAYNSLQSVADIEAIRCALGVERIRLIGASYGSHLGLAYIKYHPERVACAVLMLVEGLDDTIKLPAAIEYHFDYLEDRAARAEELQGRVLNMKTRFLEMKNKLDETQPSALAPGDEPCQINLTGLDLQLSLIPALGDIKEMAALPKRLLALESGDYTDLVARAARMRRGLFYGGINCYSGMALAMDAASGLSAARAALIESQRHGTLLDDLADLPHPFVREAAGIPDLGDEFRSSFTSDVPVCLISGTLDGRTPITNAEQVRKGFPNSVHLIVKGCGHAPPKPPGALAEIKAFLGGKFDGQDMSFSQNFTFAKLQL